MGGNSGSPVINTDAEVVGLVFDGNIQFSPNRFVLDGLAGRTVSVHSSAILEALSQVYGADHLVRELKRTLISRGLVTTRGQVRSGWPGVCRP